MVHIVSIEAKCEMLAVAACMRMESGCRCYLTEWVSFEMSFEGIKCRESLISCCRCKISKWLFVVFSRNQGCLRRHWLTWHKVRLGVWMPLGLAIGMMPCCTSLCVWAILCCCAVHPSIYLSIHLFVPFKPASSYKLQIWWKFSSSCMQLTSHVWIERFKVKFSSKQCVITDMKSAGAVLTVSLIVWVCCAIW